MAGCKEGRCKKILVAVDGSPASLHALRESFKFATNEKSWVTVTCVTPAYEGDLGSTAFGNVQHAMKQPCEKALAEAAALAQEARVLIKTVPEEGVPYERIIDLAEAENCDFIVMGRRGVSSTRRALVGSVSARVIGYSQRDVLLIPLQATVHWRTIAVATDGSRYSRAAVEKAIEFADAYGGRLAIVSAVNIPAEFYGEAPLAVDEMINEARRYVEAAREQARAAEVSAEAFVREGPAHEVITTLAEEHKADIIVLGSHGKTGLKRLLMGSVTEKVIGHAACQVLVVRS